MWPGQTAAAPATVTGSRAPTTIRLAAAVAQAAEEAAEVVVVEVEGPTAAPVGRRRPPSNCPGRISTSAD